MLDRFLMCLIFFISIVSFLGTIRPGDLFIKTIKQIDDTAFGM